MVGNNPLLLLSATQVSHPSFLFFSSFSSFSSSVDVEWTLKNVGAVPSPMRENPRQSKIRDVMASSLNDDF